MVHHRFHIDGRINASSEDEALDVLKIALDNYHGLVVDHICVGDTAEITRRVKKPVVGD